MGSPSIIRTTCCLVVGSAVIFTGFVEAGVVPDIAMLSPWEKWMVKKAEEELRKREELRKALVCIECKRYGGKSLVTDHTVDLKFLIGFLLNSCSESHFKSLILVKL